MDWIGYGDSSHTADGKYVIASFRADANLAWVVDLRSFLNIAELKYRDYAPLEQKYWVQANAPLYRNLIRGLSEAELTIIDQEKYDWKVYFDLIDKGAKPNEDFDLRTVRERAADMMLRDSPLSLRPTEGFSMDRMREGSAVLEELTDFDPTDIRRRSGGKHRDAVVLSARAHSMLSPSEFMELRLMVEQPYLRGSIAENMERIAKLGHVFDVEHPKSLPILNELVGQVAEASGIPHHAARLLSLRNRVREEPSNVSDHIQAADFAAGWAAELLNSTDGDYRALAGKVRWVGVNGVAIPG
jgi:hypothetical protein